jgi:hypothetical protein
VLTSSDVPNPRNPSYSGVNRIPAYPSDFQEENPVLDDYVFGCYKNEKSNLIDNYGKARELLERLHCSSRNFEIIGWCHESDKAVLHSLVPPANTVTHLGADVAVINGDYWSIVDDIPSSPWATSYVTLLNNYGLLPSESIALKYLREYRKHAEADWDCDFEVGTVVRIE